MSRTLVVSSVRAKLWVEHVDEAGVVGITVALEANDGRVIPITMTPGQRNRLVMALNGATPLPTSEGDST